MLRIQYTPREFQTMNPTPCTLNPAPCTLNPAPYTLNPKPLSQNQAYPEHLITYKPTPSAVAVADAVNPTP